MVSREIHLDFRARPSALAFMLRAVRPSPGLRKGVPAISARWRHRVDPAELKRFHALCGLPEGEALPLLYPHTIGFPLQMAILTQPAFPVPIWKILQVRNRIVQHAPLVRDATLDIAVKVGGHRILEKGAEFDLHTTVNDGRASVWESVNTFYMRGRFGAPTAVAMSEAPKVGPGEAANWRMPDGGGWHFGGLSGDYNGVHLFGWYARRLGFPRAFFHPPRVLSQCLARLPRTEGPTLRLEAWIKGPVFYGAPVAMRHESDAEGARFALHVDGDQRPAIVGHLRRAPAADILE